MRVHGTCVEIDGVACLLRGPPGSGKSDLALRLIDGGAALVADDQVELALDGGHLIATAPSSLAGQIEVRGHGIVHLPAIARSRLGLVVDLVATDEVERMPEAECCELLGIGIPRIQIAPFEASAAAKVRLAIATGPKPIITDP